MGFFSRLFPDPSVKKALAALVIVHDELKRDGGYSSLDEALALSMIKSELTDKLQAMPDAVEKALNENKEPLVQFAWKGIYIVAKEHAVSGQHHFYRGVLNDRGKAFLKLCFRAIDEMDKSGAFKKQTLGR